MNILGLGENNNSLYKHGIIYFNKLNNFLSNHLILENIFNLLIRIFQSILNKYYY